jgi:hypothetical protein
MHKEIILSNLVDLIIDQEFTTKQLLLYLNINYGYKQSYSYRLIAEARKIIKRNIDNNITDYIKLLTNNYYDLMKLGEYNLAYKNLKDINKLLKK